MFQIFTLRRIYPFVIYQWRFHGLRDDLVFYPVSTSKKVTARLSALLERAADDPDSRSNISRDADWDALDSHHYSLWSEARQRHRQRTQELVQYRRESLATSHMARLSLLKEQLSQASEEKIRRMRQSQIDAADADYARRIQELGIAMEGADITARPVAYGVIRIDGGAQDGQ